MEDDRHPESRTQIQDPTERNCIEICPPTIVVTALNLLLIRRTFSIMKSDLWAVESVANREGSG